MDEKDRIKIVLFGDEKTGKTLFIQFFFFVIENCDFENYQSTIGVSYAEKELMFNNKSYIIELWDTSGQVRYEPLLKAFITDADIMFILYDYNNKNSFERAKELVNYAKNFCKKKSNICFDW